MKPFVFLLMIAAILGANYYVILRLWQMTPGGPVARTAVTLCVAVALASMLLSILAGGAFPSWMTSWMYRVGTAWFFVFLYLLMGLLLLDLARLLRLFPDGWLRGNGLVLGALALTVCVVMVWGYVRYRDKARVELTVPVSGALPAGRPLTIVAVSDLHLGYGIGSKEFDGWVDRINAEKPDLVLIGGDAIDNSLRPLREQRMEEGFRRIRSAYGVYAVPGNHEYIAGIDASVAFLGEAGVRVLRDSVALVGGELYLVGRDDRTNAERLPLSVLTAPLDRARAVIVLDHQPIGLDEAAEAGADLQFSGHTHRGQVWPFTWATDRIFELSHGFLQKGRSRFYVSTGLGIWGGKFRIGSRSEYVVIHLVPEGAE